MTAFIDRLPTIASLKAEITSRILGQRSDAGMGPGSDGAIMRDVLAYIAFGLHLHLRYGVLDNLIPTKAGGVYADAWAYLFGLPDGSGGYGRIKARGSSATDGVTITATGASADLQDEEFTDSSGNTYKIDESYSFGGAGSANLDVAAVTKAAATNIALADNETFTWVSTPASISATITQYADFVGGADRETDSEIRGRLQTRLQTPPQGGNWANWRDWVEDASPGAIKAYVWPQRQYSDGSWPGYGCVDYCAFLVDESGSDRYILDTDDMWDTIDDAITDNAPVLLMRNSRQLEITATNKTIELDLEMASNVSPDDLCDWDAEALDTTVGSYDEPNLRIGFAADVTTSDVASGDLIIVDDYELEVDGVGIAGGCASNQQLSVTTWPWGTGSGPSNGLHLMSGGGVIKTAVDALRAYADSLGPAVGDYAAPIAGWDDTLRLSGIKSAVIQACGGKVVDMTIATPATDEAPGYDDDSDVEAITVGGITVWEPK